MLHDIIGIRPVSFTAQDGRTVSGTTLYVAFAEAGVIGQATEKLFVNPTIALPKGLKPGDTVDISFNRRGKVEAVTGDSEVLDV